MKAILYGIIALPFVLLLGLWLRTQIHYRIGSKHVKILLLGIPVRRVKLADITHISKRRPRFSENWSNTLRPNHRTLNLKRDRGLFRNFVITPRNRYIFMADLQNAIRRVKGLAPNQSLVEEAEREEEHSAP